MPTQYAPLEVSVLLNTYIYTSRIYIWERVGEVGQVERFFMTSEKGYGYLKGIGESGSALYGERKKWQFIQANARLFILCHFRRFPTIIRACYPHEKV